VVDLDALTRGQRAFLNDPAAQRATPAGGAGGAGGAPAPAAPVVRLSASAAAIIMGGATADLEVGRTGGRVSASFDLEERAVPEYARNVVGIIRGSDPALRNTYVALGAHNDHVGYNATPVDHDSLRAWHTLRLRKEMAVGMRTLTAAERAEIVVNVDSLRRIRPARPDSIFNGADDDGSGSMALLEIAEAIAAMPRKPARSVLLVWHTAEEGGLVGSAYFTDNPTVPRDSIMAQINIDMIGRGRAEDILGGGPDYLAVLGASRLSTGLGEAVAQVNARQGRPLALDYRFDDPSIGTPATGTWLEYRNLYGRSDHANYARFNIPIAFFFTGLHQDYHMVTDEPEYINFPLYTRITSYLHDLAVELAQRPQRLVVDKSGDRD
jgi:hypothetical protein